MAALRALLVAVGLVVAVYAGVVLWRGHLDWARLRTRKAGGVVLVVAVLFVTVGWATPPGGVSPALSPGGSATTNVTVPGSPVESLARSTGSPDSGPPVMQAPVPASPPAPASSVDPKPPVATKPPAVSLPADGGLPPGVCQGSREVCPGIKGPPAGEVTPTYTPQPTMSRTLVAPTPTDPLHRTPMVSPTGATAASSPKVLSWQS